MDFKGRKINLGAGNAIMDEYINHDRWYHNLRIDAAWDLDIFPYPWDDDTFSEIRMWDVLEHLREPLRVLSEFHRILQSGGKLEMRVVGENSKTRWIDPTHLRPYTTKSLNFLDPEKESGERFGFYARNKWHIDEAFEDAYYSIIFKMKPIK